MMKILSLITSLIPKSKIGIILQILIANISSTIIKEILDRENQQIAYYFVLQLRKRDDLKGHEKAALFNLQMEKWAVQLGKKIHESAMNCLREMAVNALKSESKQEDK